ncbi:mechanosensitive ion channel family protein [Microvirga thermotolerans]|uniref:Mechanosensitive ion channel n=1 Tax=Microvirga thermotolerans TaxID=2651334 RepID=A0A5P9JWW6_9HYPH|nr:mechanosensitive ion channel domain-containing protein [Microvirga thermotolerans]QFU16116.1 mechanosensitive ion channel [Microvirga thermotolerans]
MRGSRGWQLREATVPLVFLLLVSIFVAVQFLATPPALGSLSLLAPPQTSSPRATLEDFRSNVRRATTLLMDAYRENSAEPGLFWSRSVKEKVKEAEALLARAARALDLRDVPPVELEHRRLESTLLLKEVLDRLPLPPPAAIPGDAEVDRSPIPSWTIPGTEIRIVRVTDGPRAGEYLFSGETVRQLESLYRLIREQPDLSGVTADFYDFYSQSPGHLLPPKWYGLIEKLPRPFRVEIEGQAVWQWIGFFLAAGLCAGAVFAVHRLVRRVGRRGGMVASLLATVLVPATMAVACIFLVYVADYQINLTGRVNEVVDEIGQGLAYLALIWAVLKFSNGLAGQLSFTRSESIDAHLARASVRIGGIAAAIVLLIYGASYLGIPLAGLLAGLGVGGLAVALAAKPTLENFIGGLILYADRPVRVGDLCRFGNLEGRVQEIGIRSTRIRGLDRSLITIPNATFVNMNIINLTNRDRMPYVRTVGLQATDSVAIRREVEEIARIVAQHPEIEPDSVQVRLRDVHEEKPKAEIQALITTSRWDRFLQIQQDIDLMLRDAFAASKEADAPAEASNVYSLKESEETQAPKVSTAS